MCWNSVFQSFGFAVAFLSKRSLMIVAGLTVLGFASLGYAQAETKTEDEKEKIASPEELSLDTKDGLFLKATYYAGPKSKQTVPVILLHDHQKNSSRAELETLAKFLQKEGKHSVLVPDLRGFGESNRYRAPNGDIKTLDPNKLTNSNYEQIVTFDYPTMKAFLREKNNSAELNLSQIAIVGIGSMGSALAMNMAFYDWTRPQLIGYKTGEDVRAIVLISPASNFAGLTVAKPLNHPELGSGKVSKMLLGGKKDSDLGKLTKQFESRHGKQPTSKDEKLKHQNLFIYELPTSVSGIKLLDPSFDLGVDNRILGFLDLRLAKKFEEMPWQDRPTPR